MYIRFYAYYINISLKINYLPLTLKGVIDFLPSFRARGKRKNQHNIICIKTDNQIKKQSILNPVL